MEKASETSGALDAGEDVGPDAESVRLAVKLPAKQRLALDAFGSGASVSEAAERAKVDPSTVRRWLTHNARFIAAHNAVVLENIRANRAEMASLIPLAAAAIRKELEKGNGWIAMQLYRDARSLGLLDAGPTSVQGVRKELKLAQETHEAELVKKQVELQQLQQQIEKLQEQIDQANRKKAVEGSKNEAYWYACLAFNAHWIDEHDSTVQDHNASLAEREQAISRDNTLYDDARRAWPKERCRPIIDEAHRLQQADEEKKQRGIRVKSAKEQLASQKSKQRQPLNKNRQNEQHAGEHNSDAPNADIQSPDIQNPDAPDTDEHRPEDQSTTAASQPDDAQRLEIEERPMTEQPPLDDLRPELAQSQPGEQQPADDARKSNPDIEPADNIRSDGSGSDQQRIESESDRPA